jgi:hypothetical protein
MRSPTRRRLVALVLAIGAAAVVAAPVAAHDPIPTGTKRNFGGATNVTYRRVSSPGTWFDTNVATVLETNFRASSANNSRAHRAASRPEPQKDRLRASRPAGGSHRARPPRPMRAHRCLTTPKPG